MKQPNRRESHRVEIKLRCRVTMPAIRMRGAMHIENIGRSSLLVVWRSETGSVPAPLIGQMVTVDVELPDHHCFGAKCIHCQGTIARISREDPACPRVGVRLDHMDFRSISDPEAVQSALIQMAISWMR